LSGTAAGFAPVEFVEHTIRTGYSRPWCVYTVDVNRDSVKDVVSSAYGGGLVSWWENDGSQNFREDTVAQVGGPLMVLPSDLDRDGDVDVVAALDGESRFAWFENDGQMNFTKNLVAATLPGACSICADDFDGDGDVDVLGAADFGNKVAWWENTPAGIEEARDPAELTGFGPTLTSGRRLPDGTLVFDVSGRRMNPHSLKPGVHFLPEPGEAMCKVIKAR
jgi:hypothetical protein